MGEGLITVDHMKRFAKKRPLHDASTLLTLRSNIHQGLDLDNRPGETQGKVHFTHDIAITLLHCASLLEVPLVQVGSGNGATSEGRKYVSFLDTSTNPATIVYNSDQLDAYLEGSPSHLRPIPHTAHEMGHLWQYYNEFDNLIRDLKTTQRNPDNSEWEATVSERAAWTFSVMYAHEMASVPEIIRRNYKRISQIGLVLEQA